jgi:hypothetical protein
MAVGAAEVEVDVGAAFAFDRAFPPTARGSARRDETKLKVHFFFHRLQFEHVYPIASRIS